MHPYELYLIRHGIAEERGDAWPDDGKRPLSGEGVVRLRKSVRGLARLGVRLDLVLTSPLTRTRQTADLVAAAFEPRPTVVAVEALAPSGTTQGVLADLAKHGKKESIAIIGHEPNIGELAARLVGARRPFQFKKGAVCRIDIDTLPPAGPGVLRWFLTPRILRSVGK